MLTRALLAVGRLDEVERRLLTLEVTDIREGEVALSDLWDELQTAKLEARGFRPPAGMTVRDYVRQNLPPPARIDFRMAAQAKEKGEAP